MFGDEPIVRHKTPEERDAEDRWWNSLTEEQRKADTARWLKDYNERAATKAMFAMIVVVAYIILAAVPAVVMFVRHW